MTVMTSKEIEERFGITEAQVEEWATAWERGELPGKPVGSVTVGRPMLLGEPLRAIAFKESEYHIAQIDARAKSLGMRRSDYLRWLIHNDLNGARAK